MIEDLTEWREAWKTVNPNTSQGDLEMFSKELYFGGHMVLQHFG